MSTRELIDAIEAGSATEIDAAFNSVMVNKVAEKLDAMRDDLSQNMFRTQQDVQTEVEPEQEETQAE